MVLRVCYQSLSNISYNSSIIVPYCPWAPFLPCRTILLVDTWSKFLSLLTSVSFDQLPLLVVRESSIDSPNFYFSRFSGLWVCLFRQPLNSGGNYFFLLVLGPCMSLLQDFFLSVFLRNYTVDYHKLWPLYRTDLCVTLITRRAYLRLGPNNRLYNRLLYNHEVSRDSNISTRL